MLYRSLLAVVLGVGLLGYCAQAQLVINEICADNGAFLSPGGTTPDYVEIYNTTSSAVSLKGWTLTDSLSVATNYSFPTNTSIAGRGRLVVWLDNMGFSVTTIVAKLFNVVLPDVTVFGAKDFQQAAVVQRMTRDLNFPVKIVVAPTIRSNGLAP